MNWKVNPPIYTVRYFLGAQNAFFVIAGESTEKEAQRKEKNMGKAKKKRRRIDWLW